MIRSLIAALLAGSAFTAAPLHAQQSAPVPGTIVIVTPADVVAPVPTLYNNDQPTREIGDLLFLRLAEPGRALRTSDEKSFEPRLARRWHRPDRLTLVFELDPRAQWQDGVPVTAHDVVFTINRARDPATDPQIAGLLRHITSVDANGDHQVTFHFDRDYPEQFYDATYHQPPLPAHLVEQIPQADLAKSEFVAHPVGNGPYRWVRRTAAQQLIELAADTSFFLGRPGIGRVIFQATPDPEARANLLESGEADATDNLYQFASPSRMLALTQFQTIPFVSLNYGFILFNTRDPADTTRPHPILQDPEVRKALTEGLNRDALARTGYGPSAVAPAGPTSQGLWVFDRKLAQFGFDTAAARRRLLAAGWSDHDGDGIMDKDGRPLRLGLLLASSAMPRRRIAEQAQEMYRALGIDLQLLTVERGEYVERRKAGRYDLEFAATNQDPTPSGLTQTWRCGGTNSARFCDPGFDSLTQQAIASSHPAELWRQALQRIIGDAPAIWTYAPIFVGLVHRRFDNVTLRTQSTWLDLWRWRLKPGAALPRDRGDH